MYIYKLKRVKKYSYQREKSCERICLHPLQNLNIYVLLCTCKSNIPLRKFKLENIYICDK